MRRIRDIFPVPVLLAALALPAGATAQVGPEETIKKILEDISEQMSEIDRLLLEASKSRQAAEGIEQSVERMKDLMTETQSGHTRVIEGIDELIRQIEQMPSSGGGGGGQFDPNQDQRSGGEVRDQEQQGRRDQSETPDLTQPQGGQQQQEQQGQPQQGEQPQDGPDEAGPPGENVPSDQPKDGATERAVREEDNALWGNLPPYLQFLHSRGHRPEVPEKYRRLLEAYQKQPVLREGDGRRDR